MVIRLDGKSILRRVLCLVLLLLIMVLPIMVPAAQAVAIEVMVAEYAVEIIAGILIAGGVSVAGSPDIYKIAQAYYDWLDAGSSAIKDKIWGWATTILDNGLDVAKTAVRVSADVWQSFVDFLQAKGFSSGALSLGTANFIDFSADYSAPKVFVLDQYYDFIYTSPSGSGNRHFYDKSKQEYFWYYFSSTGVIDKIYDTPRIYALRFERLSTGAFSLYFIYKYSDDYFSEHSNSCVFAGEPLSNLGSLSIKGVLDIAVSGDLVWPGEDTLVKAPDIPSVETDADGKEVVVVPDLSLNPADHVADIPTVNPDTGEPIKTVPFDVPVDLSTGQAIDDVTNPDKSGEGEGEGGSGIWDWFKSLLQKILDAINGLIGALLDGLKALLISLFVPGDTFLTDAFSNVLSPLQNKLPIGVYNDLLGQLQNVGAKELQNIQVTLYGQTMTIIDWSYYKANKATFDDIIRGIVFIILLAYNINNIYKLVRNNDILSGKRGGEL